MRARAAALLLLVGCQGTDDVSRADADLQARGRLLLEQYDCGSCHAIPGVRRASGEQGPTLHHFALRAYIAGELPSRADVLVQWIHQPSSLVKGTLMPDQGVPTEHAQAMAAYLLRLQ